MSEQKIISFPPVVGDAPEILILGSMPSVRSLRAQQYYAHPQNAFWRIIGDICGFSENLEYAQKLTILKRRKIALWDVIKTCKRDGSLDSRIIPQTVEVNDFVQFFNNYPKIRTIFFNGATAAQKFQKEVYPHISPRISKSVKMLRLPSTSPAMAMLSFAQKCEKWSRAFKST